MAAALATSWLVGGAPARAQVTSEPSAVVFPDPAKFAHGFFTEGEFGVLVVHRAAPATRSRPGFAVGARVGYDIFRFFAVQLHLLGLDPPDRRGTRRSPASCCRRTRGRSRGS